MLLYPPIKELLSQVPSRCLFQPALNDRLLVGVTPVETAGQLFNGRRDEKDEDVERNGIYAALSTY